MWIGSSANLPGFRRKGVAVWFLATAATLAGASAAWSGANGDDDRQRARREVLEKQKIPWPDLAGFTTPQLEAALKSPDKLLAFITSPETSYKERRAAMIRCAYESQGPSRMPPEFVPRIVTMLAHLREERSIHHWGLKPHPLNAAPVFTDASVFPFPRDRIILGHPWRVPDTRIDFPTTFEETSAAPWPVQVEHCLDQIFVFMSPRPSKEDTPITERWMNACMTMPVSTDREAELFVEATLGGSWMHAKSIPVMARWLQIALDPTKPNAAVRVAWATGEACRLWQNPAARSIGDIMIFEILTRSPHPEARRRAAYGLRHLRGAVLSDDPPNRFEEPTLSILAACDRAVAVDTDPWERLYCFAISACENLDDPPLKVERGNGLKPGSERARELLRDFETWYADHRAALAARAENRRQALKPLIDRLKAGS